MCRWDITGNKKMRTKLTFILLLFGLNIFASDVYIGGYLNDGTSNIPCIWKNGKLAAQAPNDAQRYVGISEDNGNIYLCCNYVSHNSSYTVYKLIDNGEEQHLERVFRGTLDAYNANNIYDFTVLNGSFYLICGSWSWSKDLFKNNEKVRENCGDCIVNYDGMLCYGIVDNDKKLTKYVFGRDSYPLEKSNAAGYKNYHHLEKIRISNDNVYLLCNPDKSSDATFVNYIYRNGQPLMTYEKEIITDICESGKDLVYIIGGYKLALEPNSTCPNSTSGYFILSSLQFPDYSGLKIDRVIPVGNKLFILGSLKSGSRWRACYWIYNKSTREYETARNLTPSGDVKDIIVL